MPGARGRNEPDGSPGIISPPQKRHRTNKWNKEKQGGGFFPGYPGKADPHRVTEGPAESEQPGKPGAVALSGVVMAMKV